MAEPTTETALLTAVLQQPSTRRERLEALRDELLALRARAEKRERKRGDEIERVHPSHRVDAENLAHYLALRLRDLRPLQTSLTAMGLSSLGRMESDVLGNVDAVLAIIADALGGADATDAPDPAHELPRERLHRAGVALLAGQSDDRAARIMVTLPSEAALEPDLVADFAAAGMDIARINCAHDDPEAWAMMAANVHAANPAVPIAMDLAGPKVRTGPIVDAPDGKKKRKKSRRPFLRVHVGDLITLIDDDTPVEASEGPVHRIGCTLPEALASASVGHRVAFDDGKIAGDVVGVRPGSVDVRVTLAAEGGTKLRAKKGINLPDGDIRVPALTGEDREALPHAVAIADIVQLSFTRSARDVRDLLTALDELAITDPRAAEIGVVVKIETPSGFAALPEILFELMRRERVGVMIARGDLGVEVGYARLAEVQEEMLWLCEAARVPVIWATEVLANLAATGVPSRAEVTDAAAGARAECIMLNKGPHTPRAIRALDDILRRMKEHADKKRPLLRKLRSWQRE